MVPWIFTTIDENNLGNSSVLTFILGVEGIHIRLHRFPKDLLTQIIVHGQIDPLRFKGGTNGSCILEKSPLRTLLPEPLTTTHRIVSWVGILQRCHLKDRHTLSIGCSIVEEIHHIDQVVSILEEGTNSLRFLRFLCRTD